MASSGEYLKYDEMLSSVLVNEKSILGFLSAIFNFLARRTDFYYIAKGPHMEVIKQQECALHQKNEPTEIVSTEPSISFYFW